MSEEEFIKKYPDLNQFLGAFVIQCYESKSDDEIIEENFDAKSDARALNQAKEVLQLENFPDDVIESITNIGHENISTKNWFIEIISKLERKLQKK